MRACDPWWEPETEWHKGWKAHFPEPWHEVRHEGDGEARIADVKTDQGWVVEIQQSHIKPEERRSREAFYGGMVWVVDGTRRKTDAPRFYKALAEWSPAITNQPVRKLWSPASKLVEEWVTSSVHVFFDLGEPESLWWLSPTSNESNAIVARVTRASFITAHQSEGDFDAAVARLDGHIRPGARPRVMLPPAAPPTIVSLLTPRAPGTRGGGRGGGRQPSPSNSSADSVSVSWAGRGATAFCRPTESRRIWTVVP